MPSQDLGPEWIISNRSSEVEPRPLHHDDELITVARKMWPGVQAHALREAKTRQFGETVALATEVWERVLQSVSKTRERLDGKGSGIVDLEAYLFGVFHHRFNRALKKERRRQETIELVPSSRDLEQLPGARDLKSARDLELSIQVKEVIQNMDDWTRRAWAAKVYGYTWKEIGEHMGLSEHQAKLRFGYALRKLAERLGFGK